MLLRKLAFSSEFGTSTPSFFQKSSFSFEDLEEVAEDLLAAAMHLLLKEELEDEDTAPSEVIPASCESDLDFETLESLKVTFFFFVEEEVTFEVGNDKDDDLAGDTTGPGVIVTIFCL